ncbi:MAG: PIG-L deacetylase family protein [Acidimicrobiales bacterium]
MSGATSGRPAGRALVVVAHPDDVDFGAAGTVATWVGAGTEVAYCIVTDGDAGGFDSKVPRADIAGIRRAEQRAAAAVVGVTDVRFLGYPDGRVAAGIELRRDIARVIRQVRPDRVLTQSPVRNLDRIQVSHPDHLAVGEATLCAVYPDARNPFAHPELAEEGLAPHVVSEVWLAGFGSGTEGGTGDGAGAAGRPRMVAVDVTAVVDRKLDALRCHESQMVEISDLEGMIRGWLSATAAGAGLPAGRLAEAFRVVPTG